MSVNIEIVCIGNELLIGKTLNTNAHWLARRSTALGATVKRVTVVGDELDEIANVIREALKRHPRIIMTTGGLGPTFDDRTLEGISKGIDVKLEVNKKAFKMVRSKYDALLREKKIEKVEMTPARVKMATFPKCSKPLPNSVGTAPGMLAKVKKTLLFALPGVPPEMESIFTESVAPILRKEVGESAFYERSLFLDGMMESTLAPLIDQAICRNPGVYIKSHVYTKSSTPVEGKTSHIELHFSTTAKRCRSAQTRLEKAIIQLTELVQKSGGKTSREQNGDHE